MIESDLVSQGTSMKEVQHDLHTEYNELKFEPRHIYAVRGLGARLGF